MLILKIIGIIVLVPLIGGLISGIDRVISARLQGRKGPPLLQPFYDVLKLFQKESVKVNDMHRFYIYVALIFVAFSSVIMLLGGDILLAIFVLTLGSVFFVLGGFSSNSPYSHIGSERELLQIMAYEPMVLLAAIGIYYITHSFYIRDIISATTPAIVYLPGIFLGLVFILTFKLRKSPFDISMSHHGHQEIVQGLKTEYSGRDLAIISIIEWFEVVIALVLVYIFFAAASPISHVVAVIACIVVYLLEILVDNSSARIKWQKAFKSSWIFTGIAGTINLIVLSLFK